MSIKSWDLSRKKKLYALDVKTRIKTRAFSLLSWLSNNFRWMFLFILIYVACCERSGDKAIASIYLNNIIVFTLLKRYGLGTIFSFGKNKTIHYLYNLSHHDAKREPKLHNSAQSQWMVGLTQSPTLKACVEGINKLSEIIPWFSGRFYYCFTWLSYIKKKSFICWKSYQRRYSYVTSSK